MPQRMPAQKALAYDWPVTRGRRGIRTLEFLTGIHKSILLARCSYVLVPVARQVRAVRRMGRLAYLKSWWRGHSCGRGLSNATEATSTLLKGGILCCSATAAATA